MADPNSLYRLLAEGPGTVSLSKSVAAKFRRVGLSGGHNPFVKIDAPVFGQLLQAYTRRRLTYPDDFLRAMTGIMRYYERRVSYSFLEGMPAEAFDAFVLFRSDECRLQRRRGCTSYSWAGWAGHICFAGLLMENNAILNTWLGNSCPVSWSVADGNDSTSPTSIWRPDLWEQVRGPRQELLQKWVQRLCDHTTDGLAVADKASSGTPTRNHVLSAETAGKEAPNSFRLLPPQQRGILQVRYKILQFWALSVYLHIETRKNSTATGWILTANGEKVGVAWLDGTQDTALLGSPELLELIMISEATGSHQNLTDEEVQALGSRTYNVLLVERGRPIAERRGVGLLAESGARKSAPPGPRLSDVLLG